MANNITFYTGTQAEYQSSTKDQNGVYFISPSSNDTIGKIYKGNVEYGSSQLNIASSSSLGGIKVSDDFDISADGTLTLYTPIAISSFSNNHATNEIGASISSVTVNYNLNKMPTKLTLTYGNNTQSINLAQSGSLALSNFSSPITTNTTFTLQATDSHNKTVDKTTSVNFYHGRYYGVSTVNSASGVTNDFVTGLTRELVSGRSGQFTVTAGTGQYIYYAIPASWGTPDFSVGGFSGGFSIIRTFDFKNASGNVTSYNVFKSTNANLGPTKVVVS